MRLSGVAIGEIAPADIDEIVALERQAAGAAHWQRADYEMLLAADDVLRRRGVLARNESGVVGFAIAKALTVNGETEAELELIVVRADVQRKGVGGELMSALLARLERDGVAKLRLEVRSSNLAAISLYQVCGFRHAGLRRRYYRNPEDDAVLMELRCFDAKASSQFGK